MGIINDEIILVNVNEYNKNKILAREYYYSLFV